MKVEEEKLEQGMRSMKKRPATKSEGKASKKPKKVNIDDKDDERDGDKDGQDVKPIPLKMLKGVKIQIDAKIDELIKFENSKAGQSLKRSRKNVNSRVWHKLEGFLDGHGIHKSHLRALTDRVMKKSKNIKPDV